MEGRLVVSPCIFLKTCWRRLSPLMALTALWTVKLLKFHFTCLDGWKRQRSQFDPHYVTTLLPSMFTLWICQVELEIHLFALSRLYSATFSLWWNQEGLVSSFFSTVRVFKMSKCYKCIWEQQSKHQQNTNKKINSHSLRIKLLIWNLTEF